MIRAAVRVEDLPAPPAGKSGWPWTEGSLPPADEGTSWPRISVVTPSYNQADFLEETIRSVLLQGYPDLEYMIADGGSDDGSVEIIERYSPWIDWWVSEPDGGQTPAVNKGLARATGDVLAWLNSDDIYFPGALISVGRAMSQHQYDLFFGAMDKVMAGAGGPTFVKRTYPTRGEAIHQYPVFEHGQSYDLHFFQPSMFWTREVWEQTGGLDDRYDYMMDMEWCLRALALGVAVGTTEDVFSRFTLHPTSKTVSWRHRQLAEEAQMYRRLGRRPDFRSWECWLSSARPHHRALVERSKHEVGIRRAWFRSLGVGVGLLRRSLPRLRQGTRMHSSTDLTEAG